MVAKQKAAFLDRDGVLNKTIIKSGKPFPPRLMEEIELCEGVQEAIDVLHLLKFKIIVITNQPDISRGHTTLDFVNTVHRILAQDLRIDHFYICAHDDNHKCNCRKPLPGLIKQAANELSINIEKSILVGDRWSDIEAGQAVGCRCFFINYNYKEKKPNFPYLEVNSLLEVANNLLRDGIKIGN